MRLFFKNSPLIDTAIKEALAPVREARLEDFDSIYEIWMQDHINPFMSFEKMSTGKFRDIYKTLFDSSHIYVLEEDNKVVAVQRIVYGSGLNAHTAYFCSFGVHKDYLRKGYGQLFYDKFLILLSKNPHISRVELTQETDNSSKALYLAEKNKFTSCGTFPEWQPRLTGPQEYINKWPVAERIFERIIKEEILKDSKDSPSFEACIPPLMIKEREFNVVKSATEVSCYTKGELVATCKIENGVRRLGHIQFWSVQLAPNCDLEIASQFLRQLAMETKNQYKKIEIFSHDEKIISIIRELGFHYRVKKTASCKIGNEYYSQTGGDLSFYNIQDARKVLEYSKIAVNCDEVYNYLQNCAEAINEAAQIQLIDEYGKLYLENLAFQMVREVHSEALYDKTNKPWERLIEEIPDSLAAFKKELSPLTKKLRHHDIY